MKKEHILIALLTYRDSVNVSFLWWVDALRSLNSDPNHPRTYEVMYVPGLRPVSFARNVAATNFLNSKADKLWFIDDDLLPTDDSIKIFDSKADIVSGLYYLLLMVNAKPTFSSAIYRKINGGFDMINPKNRLIGQNIIPIDAAGTGTLLISRKVLEDPKMMNSNQYVMADSGNLITLASDEANPHFRTQYKANGSEERSEDIDFVWRAKQLGYTCECVLDARFLHKKEMLIDWFI